MTRFSLQRLRAAMPTASMPVATLALVVATVGGVSAYAGTKVGTGDIANNAVTSSKIKNANVKAADLSPKVKARSWIWKPAGTKTVTWPASRLVSLGTQKVKVPAAGLLDVTAFAASVDNSHVGLVLALVDYRGNPATALSGSDPEAVAEFYDALATANSTNDGLYLNLPKRVGAGNHTIRWYVQSYVAAAGDTSRVGLRQLTARYTPGITGSAPKWQVPDLTPRQTLRRLLPR